MEISKNGDKKGEIKQKIQSMHDDVVALCRRLRLNSKQVELILDTYKKRLRESDNNPQLEEFTH